MYAALGAKIADDSSFYAGRNPRRAAVAIHMAGIGLVTMVSLGEAVEDPLGHDTDALVDSLVSVLTAGARAQTRTA